MLLQAEKGIRGGTCRGIHQFAKANNKYKKDYDKNKQSLYLSYWEVNNLYGWAVSKMFLLDIFKWVGNISLFSKYFYRKVQ